MKDSNHNGCKVDKEIQMEYIKMHKQYNSGFYGIKVGVDGLKMQATLIGPVCSACGKMVSVIYLKDIWENKEEVDKVKNILNNLPNVYKEVLVLRFIEEKSYEEIVDILKKPKGTIASIINKGRKIIKDKVKL